MQLGQLKLETEEYQKMLDEKEREKDQLQAKKKHAVSENPYFYQRENELIRQMLKEKNRDNISVSSRSSAKTLTK
jgi:hypothetical protein